MDGQTRRRIRQKQNPAGQRRGCGQQRAGFAGCRRLKVISSAFCAWAFRARSPGVGADARKMDIPPSREIIRRAGPFGGVEKWALAPLGDNLAGVQLGFSEPRQVFGEVVVRLLAGLHPLAEVPQPVGLRSTGNDGAQEVGERCREPRRHGRGRARGLGGRLRKTRQQERTLLPKSQGFGSRPVWKRGRDLAINADIELNVLAALFWCFLHIGRAQNGTFDIKCKGRISRITCYQLCFLVHLLHGEGPLVLPD